MDRINKTVDTVTGGSGASQTGKKAQGGTDAQGRGDRLALAVIIAACVAGALTIILSYVL